VSRVAKVQSDRDLMDSGLRALVDALGYSGAVRFLRHSSKGEGDYLLIQEKLLRAWNWSRSTRRQKIIISNLNSRGPIYLAD
jgi:hypothetical protein